MFTYKDIVGNETIITHMKHSIVCGKISHAYIFHGQSGLGKSTAAGAFAKSLQCMDKGAEPCNTCVSCRTFESGNHPDVLYIKAMKTKAIGVDDIREQISATINIKPYRYPFKIYIIPKADTMTTAAQNALLKTIEEPPDYAVFMLLADNCTAFLHTIISRCIRFRLRPVSDEQLENYLVSKRSVPSHKASFFSAYAQGNIGRAIALAKDDDFIKLREAALNLVCDIEGKLKNCDFAGLIMITRELEKYKDNIEDVLELLTLRYRDLLIDKAACKMPSGSIRPLINRLEALGQARQQLIQNGNVQMIIENLILAFRKETGVCL